MNYDAIVVGARCAGSPAAMLLARKGYRVLLVDRAKFPSDTLSTHIVQPLGVAALARWGLLDQKPPLQGGYSTYFSNFPVDGHFEIHIRPGTGFGIAPTNDGLTMIVVGWAIDAYEEKKSDYAANYRRTLESVPEVADRLKNARQEERFYGGTTPNFFRKPYGPGWALIGDAGYEKDPITAQGITDAFLAAERCVAALDEVFLGARQYDDAMARYQRDRDQRVLPMYEFTCQLASMQPPPPEMQQLLGAIQRNQHAMDQFGQMNAGTTSPAQFFAPENLGAILSAAVEG